jgi:3'-phosphoadenosine 5'-phosphosulfate sulfotransferase (PAPS reductase)/FAD synthetase
LGKPEDVSGLFYLGGFMETKKLKQAKLVPVDEYIAPKEKFTFRPGASHPSNFARFSFDPDIFENPGIDYSKYKNIIIRYSGGKDSTVALYYAVHHFYGKKKIIAAFSDTNCEYPEVENFIRGICKHFEVELVVVKPKLDFFELMEKKKRWHSKLFYDCIDPLINDPIDLFIHKNFNLDQTLALGGNRVKQAGRGRKVRPPFFVRNEIMRHDPAYMFSEELFSYILRYYKVPIWDGYSRGYARTCCRFCPAQSGQQAYALTTYHPEWVKEIEELEKIYGPMIWVSGNNERGLSIPFSEYARTGKKRFNSVLLNYNSSFNLLGSGGKKDEAKKTVSRISRSRGKDRKGKERIKEKRDKERGRVRI